MKILHLIFSFQLGGAESMLIDIANRQALYNDVYVFIINNDYNRTLLENFNKEVKVHLFNRKVNSKNLFKIVEINSGVLKLKPEIIHCHDSNIVRFLFVHCLFKTILTVHDVNLPLIGIRKYNKVIAISSTVKEHLIERNICNISIIYNGINLSKIKCKNVQQYHNIFRFIQVSRLDHLKKGQHILLKALHILICKYNCPNFHIDFVGEGNSLDYLQNLVSKYNLDEKVSFLGLKDRPYVYSHLSDYDLLIQPSIFEGFGLTVVEGMAAKIPVLVSANDGPMEIIQNGKYGFHFKKGDASDCANQIKTIIESKGKVSKITECAYKYCLNNFDIDKTSENYCKEYQNTININTNH
jgi:glycosyltransferase involved in cell wall biosynthesis